MSRDTSSSRVMASWISTRQLALVAETRQRAAHSGWGSPLHSLGLANMLSIASKAKQLVATQLIRKCLKQDAARQLVQSDHSRFLQCGNHSKSIEQLFTHNLEFRSVFFYRVGTQSFSSRLLLRMYPPMTNLYLGMKACGPGLYIEHGFSTIVADVEIGENCWINQNVTVGRTDRGLPTIGNNVQIHAGALVLGPIRIGDHVTIGAGSVVTRSIPDHCVVAGNPARIIRQNGVRVERPFDR